MEQLASGGTTGGFPILLVVALIGAMAALSGHFVLRSNAKLQAIIGEKTARLANEQSRDNAILAASLSSNVKLAEMRQAWINELRTEMINFFALCNARRIDENTTKLNDVHRSGTRIELSMNPADVDYETLRAAMFGLYNKVPVGRTSEEMDDEYLVVCQRILKREWDRLQADIKGVVNIDCAVSAGEQAQETPWYRR